MRPRERLFPILAIGTVAAGLPALLEWTAGGHHVQIDGRVHFYAVGFTALAAAAAGHHIRAARDTLLAAFDAAPTTHPIPATGAVNRPAIRLNRGRLH